ncbi:MAG: diguanylate cyclase [Desulfovibrionales bacterium]
MQKLDIQGFYRELLNRIREGIYFVDSTKRIVFWNTTAAELTGFSADEVQGKQCSDNILMHVDNDGGNICLAGCPLAKTLKDGKSRSAEVYFHHKDGHRVPTLVFIEPVFDQEGRIIGAVETFNDRSTYLSMLERFKASEEEYLLDTLTGLGNRKFGEITLQARLDEFKRYQWPFGVLFIDIDHFKKINDTHGHACGDRVLSMVGATIAGNLRSFDMAVRWGGEEFVVILTNVAAKELRKTAERLRNLIKSSKISLDGEELRVTVSIGGTMIQEHDSVVDILKRADERMYVSKREGRDRVTT